MDGPWKWLVSVERPSPSEKIYILKTRNAEKRSSRKLGFRCTVFSEIQKAKEEGRGCRASALVRLSTALTLRTLRTRCAHR